MASLQSFNAYERRHGWRYGLIIQVVIQAVMQCPPFLKKTRSPLCSISVGVATVQDFCSQGRQGVRVTLSEDGGIKYVIQFPSIVSRILPLPSAKLIQTQSILLARQGIDHFRCLDNEIRPPV